MQPTDRSANRSTSAFSHTPYWLVIYALLLGYSVCGLGDMGTDPQMTTQSGINSAPTLRYQPNDPLGTCLGETDRTNFLVLNQSVLGYVIANSAYGLKLTFDKEPDLNAWVEGLAKLKAFYGGRFHALQDVLFGALKRTLDERFYHFSLRPIASAATIQPDPGGSAKLPAALKVSWELPATGQTVFGKQEAESIFEDLIKALVSGGAKIAVSEPFDRCTETACAATLEYGSDPPVEVSIAVATSTDFKCLNNVDGLPNAGCISVSFANPDRPYWAQLHAENLAGGWASLTVNDLVGQRAYGVGVNWKGGQVRLIVSGIADSLRGHDKSGRTIAAYAIRMAYGLATGKELPNVPDGERLDKNKDNCTEALIAMHEVFEWLKGRELWAP